MARKQRLKDRRKNDDNEDVVAKDVEAEQQLVHVVPLPPTRGTDHLYASYETFACAMDCIPCAYKIGCFDVALDKEFSKSVPNQRPEQCPRNNNNNNTNSNDNGVLGFRRGMSILTVGDGDFTFSLGLARRLLLRKPSDDNNDDNTKKKNLNENDDNETFIVATSYESEATLRKVYPNFDQTLQELDDLRVVVAYNVDATKIPETYKNINKNKFHRICWNFPCTNITKGQDGQNKDMEQNKDLVRNFVKSAQSVLTNHGDGELYICHKTKPPFNQWNLEEVALENMEQSKTKGNCTFSSPRSLFYTGRVVLDKFLLPPYVPRKALDQKSFPCHDACFYIFAQEQEQLQRGGEDDLSMKLFPPTIIQHNDGNNTSIPNTKNVRGDEQGAETAAAVAAEQNLGQLCNSTTLIKIYPDLIQLIRRRHIHATNTRKRGNSTSYGVKKSKRSAKRIKRSY